MIAKPQTDSVADHRRFPGIRVLLRQALEMRQALEIGPASDRLTMAAAVLGSVTLIAVAVTIRLIAP
jgi:hypothetical protein